MREGREIRRAGSWRRTRLRRGFPDADIVFECDNADELYAQAKRHGIKIVGEMQNLDWGAHLFTVEMPVAAGKLAIFSYNENWRNKTIEADLNAVGMRFAIVVARFNAFITERLLAGATQALRQLGAKNNDIEIVRVPGARLRFRASRARWPRRRNTRRSFALDACCVATLRITT